MGLEINGAWCEEPNKVKEAVKDFFKNLFRKKEANLVELPSDMFESRLDDVDGDILTRRFSKEEIRNAVWDCENAKIPSPNGFTMEFF